MEQQPCLACAAAGREVHARPWNFQPNLHVESWLVFPLVLEDDVGGGYWSQRLQVTELFLDMPLPVCLGVEPKIVDDRFHTGSGFSRLVQFGRGHARTRDLHFSFFVISAASFVFPGKGAQRARPLHARRHILSELTTQSKYPPFT